VPSQGYSDYDGESARRAPRTLRLPCRAARERQVHLPRYQAVNQSNPQKPQKLKKTKPKIYIFGFVFEKPRRISYRLNLMEN
jgi:hypothetical protein